MTYESSLPDLEKDAEGYVYLPAEVTIGSIRDSIPNSTQLFLVIERHGKDEALEFSHQKKDYALFPQVKYLVSVGGHTKGMLYLNPLQKSEFIPEESNIPLAADKYLSRASEREKLGVRIKVFSPDADLNEALIKIQKFEEWKAARKVFDEAIGKIGSDQVLEIINEKVASFQLDNLKQGAGFNYLLSGLVSFATEYIFTNILLDKKESPDVLNLVGEVITRFLDWVKTFALPKIEEMEKLVKDENAIAFSFEEYEWDEFSAGNSSLVILTYLPLSGWSISIPTANCPNHAANSLYNWLVGQIGEKDFPNLSESIDLEVAGGDLVIDKKHRILIYKQLDKLRFNFAVYHGDDTVNHALETLKAMGDPVLGEALFDFKQIIFLDDNKFIQREPQEHITIDFGD